MTARRTPAARPAAGGGMHTAGVNGLAFATSPYHRGGIERWMTDMAIEWHRVRGASWFVTPVPRRPFINGAGRPTVGDILLAEAVGARPALRMPLVGATFEFGTEAYRASVYARAILDGVPPGVPLIVGDDSALWRAAASLVGRNPFIAVIHGEWAGYDELVMQHRGNISAFVGVSHRISRRVRDLIHDSEAPVVTIACGILHRASVGRSAPAGGPLRLAWVGRMREEAKRVSDLPRIAESLRRRGVAFTMDIMGDGEEREHVAASIRELGLEQLVTLLPWGTPTQVAELLARADVMLLPSNREGMPIIVMEALGLGCGVVATRVSGIEDYENHPAAAGCLWVYPIGDVTAAADAIVRAASMPAAERVRNAQHLAATEFSAARAVERYAELIGQLPERLKATVTTPWRDRVTELLSHAVAAQRIVRVWMTGRYRHPPRVEVIPRHLLTA